jgi:hypothetical protein
MNGQLLNVIFNERKSINILLNLKYFFFLKNKNKNNID